MRKMILILLIAYPYSLVQAQTENSSNESGSFWDGMVGSLSNYFSVYDLPPEAREAIRLMKIYNTDIQMWMVDVYGEESFFHPSSAIRYAGGSIYAEFDWDNLTEKMIIKGIEQDRFEDYYIDEYTMYTDRHANIYVPYESVYLRMNPKKAFLKLDLQIFNLSVLLDDIVSLTAQSYEFLIGYLNFYAPSGYKSLERLLPIYAPEIHRVLRDGLGASDMVIKLIRNLINEKYTSVIGFPIFIHWALMYSPDLLKAHFPVTESMVNCPDGSGTKCLKLTVSSGKDKGKSMTFDSYSRLIYIDAKKDGSVRYSYDKDLTVNVPPAITFQQLLRIYR